MGEAVWREVVRGAYTHACQANVLRPMGVHAHHQAGML